MHRVRQVRCQRIEEGSSPFTPAMIIQELRGNAGSNPAMG